MAAIIRSQFALFVIVSHPVKRCTTIRCFFAFFDNGDELLEFLKECPTKILTLPQVLEEKFYTSSSVARISDTYFITLKYIMDSLGISMFLSQRSNGFLNIMSATTGILIFSALAYQRPDFTLLSKLFVISNPQIYAVIMAINACISWEIVKKSVDFSAANLSVLVGIWSPEFFSKNQSWVITERILQDAKFAARFTILSAIECSKEAQRHLRVHGKLLRPLDTYFNPSEVEKMDILPDEFSNLDMVLLEDRLDEFDEFSPLIGTVSVQTILFLLVCKELDFSFNKTSSTEINFEGEREVVSKKLKVFKQILRVLVYRSPTLRPLTRISRLLTYSQHCLKFVKTSYEDRVVNKKKRNISYLEKCFQSQNLN